MVLYEAPFIICESGWIIKDYQYWAGSEDQDWQTVCEDQAHNSVNKLHD